MYKRLEENNIPDGLEKGRKEIVEIAQKMYDKIKHFGKSDRETILNIMQALSKYSGM